MSNKKWSGLLAGVVFAIASQTAFAAEQLTILWAQWDPADYLQELVKDYEKKSGVKVKVETVPWPDFQTKAFREFAARGDAYDMVVGDDVAGVIPDETGLERRQEGDDGQYDECDCRRGPSECCLS